MLFLILGIVLTIGLAVALVSVGKSAKYSLVGLLVCLLSFITIVPPNNVGVVYKPFKNGVSEQTLSAGIHTKGMFDKVYDISTQVETLVVEDIPSQTKDSQFLTTSIDVKYKVNEENAFNVFKQFKTMDNLNENFIAPTAQRAIEKVATNYNVIEILGSKRTEFYTEIEKSLQKEFAKSGVDFYSVTLLDTDGGAEIEQAISREAVARQEVETAKQSMAKAEIEAETKKVQAQGEVDAQIITSKGTAERLAIEAEGKAQSYQIKSEAITDDMLYLEWLNKWNGELPQVVSEDNMLNLPLK